MRTNTMRVENGRLAARLAPDDVVYLRGLSEDELSAEYMRRGRLYGLWAAPTLRADDECARRLLRDVI